MIPKLLESILVISVPLPMTGLKVVELGKLTAENINVTIIAVYCESKKEISDTILNDNQNLEKGSHNKKQLDKITSRGKLVVMIKNQKKQPQIPEKISKLISQFLTMELKHEISVSPKNSYYLPLQNQNDDLSELLIN